MTTLPLGGSKKIKGKISYLGEKINILPWQMAEQLAVEVDVKNVTEDVRNTDKLLYLVRMLMTHNNSNDGQLDV